MQRNNESSDLSEFYAAGSICTKDHNDEHSHTTTTTTNSVLNGEGSPSGHSSKVRRGQREEEPSSDNDDDYSSDDSSFSQISGFSEESGKDWKPKNKSMNFWLQKQMRSGVNPRQILSRILPSGTTLLAKNLHNMTLWRILANILQEPSRRQKLKDVNTLDDVSLLLVTVLLVNMYFVETLLCYLLLCNFLIEWWNFSGALRSMCVLGSGLVSLVKEGIWRSLTVDTS